MMLKILDKSYTRKVCRKITIPKRSTLWLKSSHPELLIKTYILKKWKMSTNTFDSFYLSSLKQKEKLTYTFYGTFPNFESNQILCNQIRWGVKQIWWFPQNDSELIYFYISWNGWFGQIIKNLIKMVWIFIRTSQSKQIVMSDHLVFSNF